MGIVNLHNQYLGLETSQKLVHWMKYQFRRSDKETALSGGTHMAKRIMFNRPSFESET
jgi:hypothetical protein